MDLLDQFFFLTCNTVIMKEYDVFAHNNIQSIFSLFKLVSLSNQTSNLSSSLVFMVNDDLKKTS